MCRHHLLAHTRTGRTYAKLDVDGKVVQVVNLLLDLLAAGVGGEVDVSLDGADRLAAVRGLQNEFSKFGTSYPSAHTSQKRSVMYWSR